MRLLQMRPVRRYLGLYALVGAAVLVAGVAGFVALGRTRAAGAALVALGGLAMFAAAAAGFLGPDDYDAAEPPTWAVVASPLGVALTVTGVGVALLGGPVSTAPW